MKSLSRFRQKLSAGECLYGLWVSLEAAAVSDIAAALGLDWVVVDAGLGHLDWSEIVEHVRAVKRSHTVALVRLGEATASQVDRAMDVGADGILVQGARTGEQLRSIVDRVHSGAATAQAATGWKHPTEITLPLVIAMVEPDQEISALSELLEVENIDAYFCDLPRSGTTTVWKTQMTEILGRKKRAGLVARTDEELLECRALGINMLGLGRDADIIFEGMRSALASCSSTPERPGARD